MVGVRATEGVIVPQILGRIEKLRVYGAVGEGLELMERLLLLDMERVSVPELDTLVNKSRLGVLVWLWVWLGVRELVMLGESDTVRVAEMHRELDMVPVALKVRVGVGD